VLTKSQAAAENFPFCTIDPNESKEVFADFLLTFLRIQLIVIASVRSKQVQIWYNTS